MAFAAPIGGAKAAVDAMIAYYGVHPSSIHGDLYGATGWLKDFHISARQGPVGEGADWRWFRRDLPWARPAGPMTDPERLEFLKTQAEKFYELMYDSRNPRFEYREAVEAFEDAVGLAHKLGKAAEGETLAKRLEHVKAVYRSQFES